MKRTYLIIIYCLVSAFAWAEFVNIKVNEPIGTDEAPAQFSNWFHVSGSSFELFNDETDDLGMRHQAYQQYYNNIAVENCIVIVHSKTGLVSYVNGDIMRPNLKPTNTVQVSRRKARAIAKASSASNADVEQTIIHIHKEDGDMFYNAYKIPGDLEDVYVDVQTGEVLKRVSHIQQFYVCNGTTKYSGERTFDAEVSNSTGNYITRDNTRNIDVCYALMDFKNSTYSDSYYFSNTTTNWNNTYLTSVTIESVNNKWWSGILDNETYPNLYITITDASDKVLYRSDYKDMSLLYNQYPVTFNIGKMIKVPSGGGYKIKIYDQDTYNDDLGFTVTLNNNTIGSHTWGQSSSNVKGSFVISTWHPAIDVIWGLQQVYDYYLDVFQRHSFDNANAKLNAIIHNPTTGALSDELTRYSNGDIEAPYNNAFAHPDTDKSKAYMHFGLGNEHESTRVGLNTIGHEYTHLICAYRSLGNLEYKGEAGALNESCADIMAKNIEHYVKPETYTWRYGCDHMFNNDCTRDFQNPHTKSQPRCYGEEGWWVNPRSSEDNGGVHTNSGVSNHWYYLLCDGGEGTNAKGYNYNVTGIGIDKAQRIVFRMLINYLPPQATFLQARNLSIQAATDLYGENSKEVQAVDEAWKAVGLGDMKNQIKPGKYWIYTTRQDGKRWFMSSDLGSASTKRFQADTLMEKSPYYIYDADAAYLWDVSKNADNTYTIKNGDKYISWTSGNSADLSSTALNLTADNDINAGTYQVSFADGSTTRYLSLNKTVGNNYFAFYANTNQQCNLYFEEFYPFDPIKVRAKMPSDWINNITAWVWRGDEEEKKQQVTLTYDDGWYEYSMVGEFCICFVNGNDRTIENNISETIYVREDCCVYIKKGQTGKRGYKYLACNDSDNPDNAVKIPYYEPFTSSIGQFEINNVELDGVNHVWRWASANYGMKASAYVNNQNHETDSWLISPPISLRNVENAQLSFQHAVNKGTTSNLKVLISEDNGYSWNILPISNWPAGTNWTFVSASAPLEDYIESVVYIAFMYVSTLSDCPTWEIKNFSVTGEEHIPTSNELTSNRNHSQAQKLLISNQLFILREGKIYNVQGQEVR